MLQWGGGVIIGTAKNATCKTGTEINKTFTASQSYGVPFGYSKIDVFAVGAGGGGGLRSGGDYGAGGGGGYTATVRGATVSPGQTLQIIVGTGGAAGSTGGASYIAGILTAQGGKPGAAADGGAGGSGGGGAGGAKDSDGDPVFPGQGGSDGADGQGGKRVRVEHKGGIGQGTTTKAWGNGTLYSGGGGGSIWNSYNLSPGAGGSGGGGQGGYVDAGGIYSAQPGTANTGGGGGGSSAGGSGIVLFRLY